MDTTNRIRVDEAKAIEVLLAQLPKDRYERVVTIGRGGLSVAQRVGYYLAVDVVQVQTKEELVQLTDKDLFVDDIACTGETLMNVMVATDTAALVTRVTAFLKPDYTGVWESTDKYIHFSWEGELNE